MIGKFSAEDIANSIRECTEIAERLGDPYKNNILDAIEIITSILDDSFSNWSVSECTKVIRLLIESKNDLPDELHDQVDTQIIVITQVIDANVTKTEGGGK